MFKDIIDGRPSLLPTLAAWLWTNQQTPTWLHMHQTLMKCKHKESKGIPPPPCTHSTGNSIKYMSATWTP